MNTNIVDSDSAWTCGHMGYSSGWAVDSRNVGVSSQSSGCDSSSFMLCGGDSGCRSVSDGGCLSRDVGRGGEVGGSNESRGVFSDSSTWGHGAMGDDSSRAHGSSCNSCW